MTKYIVKINVMISLIHLNPSLPPPTHIQLVPYLASVSTDNDMTIRSLANQQLNELDKKYPNFIQVTHTRTHTRAHAHTYTL